MSATWERWKENWRQGDQAIAEAIVLAVLARVLVRFCFRPAARWVLRVRETDARVPTQQLERRVRRAVAVASRVLPGKSLCLPNAIVGKMMLARRGFASTIHLGAGFQESGTLHAHAWLDAGGDIITGKGNKHTVTALPR